MSELYPTIRIHPSSRQFYVEQGFPVLLTVAIVLAVGCGFALPKMVPYIIGIVAAVILYLAYQYMYLTRRVYVITEEQLMCEHGIFTCQRDYVELYRVVDYSEHRSFFQMLFGVKTVSIYSGDRTQPRVDLTGIDNDRDLITTLRERVEFNKRRRNIHEFTNTH